MKLNKLYLVPLLLVFVTACTSMMVNPYNKYSSSQLTKLSIYDLCKSSKQYKDSPVVKNEVIKRGFKDCSDSELYCQENLGLKPKTPAYIHCRMQRDQHNLEKEGMMLNYLQSTQRKKMDIDLNIYHQPYLYGY